MKRELVALLVVDAVGYSGRLERDESEALAALEASRTILLAQIDRCGGAVLKLTGDGLIARFQTALAAVSAAQAAQRALAAAGERVFAFRMGVHFSEVAFGEDDFHGDGVNVAARLEALGVPAAVCISGVVADQIAGKLDEPFTRVGTYRLKNIARPVEVYCWPAAAATTMRRRARARLWPAAAGAGAFVAAAVAWFTLAPQDGRHDMPTGPRIAVLPFEEIGAPDEEAFFADGLSRDVNAYLSDFSNLFVLSPSSTRQYRGADCATIRTELGADFILGGTVRRAGDQLRVTTTFTRASTCRELDSPGPFDRDLSAASVLDVQLEIARKVVSEIGSADAPIFDSALVGELEAKAPGTLSAYQCVLLSYWFYENFAPERHRRARDCLLNAVKADPDYSLAWSRLAFAYIESKKYAIDTHSDWAEKSEAAARRAIDLDPENPDAYYALAIRSQMLGLDRAIFHNHARKAVELNPNDSFVLADLGTWMAYSGEWEAGKTWVERAKRLNPKHQSWWNFIWQLHAFLEGDYAESVRQAQIVNLPGNYMVQAVLAAAHARNGDQAKAEAILARVLELKPDYADDPEQPFRARGMPQKLIDGVVEGLRLAGLGP